MAEVEEVDLRKPDAKTLTAQVSRVNTAVERIRSSVSITEELPGRLEGIAPELAKTETPRLKLAAENGRELLDAVTQVASQLEGGSYPSMAACAAVNASLENMITRFRINSQLHEAEGF